MKKLTLLTLSAAGLAFASSAQAVIIFNDTYNTADGTDMDANIASRQAAGTTTSTYAVIASNSIEGNQFRRDGGGSTETNSNFASSIGANNFSFSTDLTMTSTVVDWTSFSMVSAIETNRGNTDLSFLLRGNDNIVISANSGNLALSKAVINGITGLESWDSNSLHNYKWNVTATTANTGNFDFLIDGISVKGANTLDYVFTDSTVRKFYWVGQGPANALFDNTTLDVVPEPSVALLGALGILGLLRRRRA